MIVREGCLKISLFPILPATTRNVWVLRKNGVSKIWLHSNPWKRSFVGVANFGFGIEAKLHIHRFSTQPNNFI